MTGHTFSSAVRLHTRRSAQIEEIQFTGVRPCRLLEQPAGVVLHLVFTARVELPADGVQSRTDQRETGAGRRDRRPLRPDHSWPRPDTARQARVILTAHRRHT